MDNLVYVIATTAICTILAMTLFVNSFVQFESRFVQWFSHLTSQPRWFTVWVFVMILWVPARHLLLAHGLLSQDGDLVVMTILWSGVPFMVENVLKSASAAQMASLHHLTLFNKEELERSAARENVTADLVLSVKEEIDRSAERDLTLHTLLTRLLDAIEDRNEGR